MGCHLMRTKFSKITFRNRGNLCISLGRGADWPSRDSHAATVALGRLGGAWVVVVVVVVVPGCSWPEGSWLLDCIVTCSL